MRSLTTAAWGLRAYWRSAVVLTVTVIAGVAVALTVASWILPNYPVLAPRFALAQVPSWDLGAPWSKLANYPSVIQWTAMVTLFRSLLGQTAIVCLVALLTVLGVSFARASGRVQEVAVRRAVGATRGTLVRSALLEVGAIALVAVSVGGVIGAAAGTHALGTWTGAVWPSSTISFVSVVVVVLAILGVDAALTAAPAWRRVMPPPLSKTPLLAVAALQLGLSVVGIAAGGEFAQGLARFRTTAQPHAAPVGSVYQISADSLALAARATAYEGILQRLKADSLDASFESPGTRVGLGVIDAGLADCGNCSLGMGIRSDRIPVAPAHFLVSADTFQMLGLSVVRGRSITASDRLGTEPVAVVSRSLEAQYQRPALGRRIRLRQGGESRWYRVVGVVDDRVPEALGGAAAQGPSVYLSVLQHPAANVELVVRPRASTVRAEQADVTAVALASGLRVTSANSETEVLAREAAPLAWFGKVLEWEGWVALFVACLGTAALMLIWVQSIRAELGIRRAVGATRARVMRYVLARAVVVAVAGIVMARWLGGLVWYWITTVVPGIPDLNAETLLRVAVVLVATALVAAVLPAWHAAQVSPAALSQSE